MAEEIPLGSVIARARQRKRWTQAELAARIGVGRDAVSDWETGKTYPQRNRWKIEEILGVDLSQHEQAAS